MRYADIDSLEPGHYADALIAQYLFGWRWRSDRAGAHIAIHPPAGVPGWERSMYPVHGVDLTETPPPEKLLPDFWQGGHRVVKETAATRIVSFGVPAYSTDLGECEAILTAFPMTLVPLEDGRWLAARTSHRQRAGWFSRLVFRFDGQLLGTWAAAPTPALAIVRAALKHAIWNQVEAEAGRA